MISMFIKHVLGSNATVDGSQHSPGLQCDYSRGFYGETEAFYGTVEQQERLTLHLHMLLWIKGSVSPQRLRELVMDPSSAFQQDLVRYLKACHQGELLTGCKEHIKEVLNEKELQYDYAKPTETLPTPPPYRCLYSTTHTCDCTECVAYKNWCSSYKEVTDDILL